VFCCAMALTPVNKTAKKTGNTKHFIISMSN
jgi:hypothetical protein